MKVPLSIKLEYWLAWHLGSPILHLLEKVSRLWPHKEVPEPSGPIYVPKFRGPKYKIQKEK